MNKVENDVIHQVTLDLMRPAPERIDADLGAAVTLRVAVETDSGCSLEGAAFELLDDTGTTIMTGTLPQIVAITPDSDDYDPRHGPVDTRPHAHLTFTAPSSPGEYHWRLAFPAQEIDGVRHGRGEVGFVLVANVHRLSLATWDSVSPVETGGTVNVKAGLKCSAGCALQGETIELVDADGEILARAPVGAEVWPETLGLYWASLAAPAPAALGLKRWRVRLADRQRPIPHRAPAPAGFSFVVTAPGKNDIEVELVEEASGTPISGAQVRFGPHRANTDSEGRARLRLPDGEYTLLIHKKNHKAPPRKIAVNGNVELKLKAAFVPEKDPYERYWKQQ